MSVRSQTFDLVYTNLVSHVLSMLQMRISQHSKNVDMLQLDHLGLCIGLPLLAQRV
ncbi:MAG: hypothetical protein P8J68_09060 [Arenicellaceae bacterium]|nr:hypothetical protein [Arenicellaceae bacterium]